MILNIDVRNSEFKKSGGNIAEAGHLSFWWSLRGFSTAKDSRRSDENEHSLTLT
jgi:transcriptional/translational regulatory protein YebC/TACO1